MSKPTTERRARLTRDGAAMRRVRRRYLRKLRAWLEADRERIYELCDRMQALGLYAPTTVETDRRSGVLSSLAKLDGAETPRDRNAWLLRTGWAAYWGCSASKARKAKAGAA